MSDLATLPLAIVRAQKVAALLALAYHADVPVPILMTLQNHEYLSDLYFHTDPDEYAAWVEWLKPTETSDDRYVTAKVTVEIADLGPLTVEWFRRVA